MAMKTSSSLALAVVEVLSIEKGSASFEAQMLGGGCRGPWLAVVLRFLAGFGGTMVSMVLVSSS